VSRRAGPEQEKAQAGGTPAKASAPSVGGVEDWRVTEERVVQEAKAEAAMEEREAGRETEEREVQLAKAEGAMAVMVRYVPR
jgi:hypothetical protein